MSRTNPNQLLGRMNQENQNPVQPMNIENKYLNATSHTGGVKTDMAILSKFVREELFYVFVHDSRMRRTIVYHLLVRSSLHTALMMKIKA